MNRMLLVALSLLALPARADPGQIDAEVLRTFAIGMAGATQLDHVLDSLWPATGRLPGFRAGSTAPATDFRIALVSGEHETPVVDLLYRSALIHSADEIAADGDVAGHGGTTTVLAITPEDYWSLHGTVNSSANETPLLARMAGAGSRRDSGEFLWQSGKGRSAAIMYSRIRFSDRNRRAIARVRWTERLVAGPSFNLEVTGAVSASSNSLAGVPYFNPARDLAPTIEIAAEWLQWQRDDHALRHRLVAAGGNYWQQGYGSAAVAGAYYEQQWDVDQSLSLRYGLGYGMHPYDGTQGARTYAYFSVQFGF